MQDNTVFIKKYDMTDERFAVNEREIWRYSGYLGLADGVGNSLQEMLRQVKEELKQSFSYRVCYRRSEITWEEEMPRLPFPSRSKNLAKCLQGTKEVLLFAATVGLEIDRKIARYQKLSPTKALLMQAYGAERIECLCDVFCKEMQDELAKEGMSCTPRYSPGYGDLPLETQIDFFRLLDCNRQIGISLNESLLMTPSKSVTAIFGVVDRKDQCSVKEPPADGKGACLQCKKAECAFRE